MRRRRFGHSLLVAVAILLVPASSASAGSFTGVNTASIAIPGTPGTATPYPTQIPVSGMTGTVSSVGVGLRSYTEPNPSGPVEVALVSPGGRAMLLMAGVGTSATGVDLDLNDQAAAQLPGIGTLASGSYKPAGYNGTAANFQAPGPGTSYGDPGPQHGGSASFASVFSGDAPNGSWSLYVQYSSTGSGTGAIANGWQLTLTTAEPQPLPPAKKKKCKKKKKKHSAGAAKKKCKKKK